jgi:RimJ/RimL family protein N-acetyltransferase
MLPRPAASIRTDRLVLRPFTMADVDDVWAYQREPAVARFMAWEPRDRDQSAASVRAMVAENGLTAEGDCLSLAMTFPDTPTVLGHVELVWLSEQHREGEIGYALHPAHQGRGLATEAASAMLRLGFHRLGLHRIVGRCNAANAASAAVLHRLGMRREAPSRDGGCVYAALSDE